MTTQPPVDPSSKKTTTGHSSSSGNNRPAAGSKQNPESDATLPDAIDQTVLAPQGLDTAEPAPTSIDAAAQQTETPNQQPTVIESNQTRDSTTLPETAFHTNANQGPRSTASHKGLVIGDYQIDGELGRGGMGVVYSATHRQLKRTAALKMVLAGRHASEELLQRFIKEAQAVAHLQHPGIVQIFDIGEHEGLPYFALEFVDGQDLQKKLNRQPQDSTFAASMVEKLATAMQYAHDSGILHRDLKPANVLLDQDGNPKITDFGLAKQVDGEDDSTGTSMGSIMGSPSYMPPEQARGEVSSLSPRSDLYSLGAILYEMLTGRPPFLAKKPVETVMQVVNNEPVAPRQLQPEIPADIETICMKAMQKEQGSRYGSCSELADDLRRFLDSKPILARPVSNTERLLKWCKRNPKIAVPSALAITAIAAAAVIATWAWQTTSAQAAVIAIERDNAQQQRDEAQKQTKIAEENEAAAETQAMVALESIQFVVKEVDGQLRGKPQLSDVRIKLMNAVTEKWEEIDIARTGGLEGEAIPTLMAVRFAAAAAFAELDEIDKAHRGYKKLETMARERMVIKDANDATRYNLAQILTAWAIVRKRVTGEPENITVPMLTEAIKLIDDVFASPKPEEGSPTASELREVRAQASQNLGKEFLDRGDITSAATAFDRSLSDNGTNLTEIREAPGFDEFNEDQKDQVTFLKQMEYDRAALSLAYVRLRKGETKESMKLYEQAIAGRREIAERRPGMTPLVGALASFISMHGQAHLLLAEPKKSLPLLDEAIGIQKTLYQQDPKAAAKGRAAAETWYRLAVAHDMLGENEKAKAAVQACQEIRTKLAAQSADIKNRSSLMLADARLGNVPSATKTADEILADEKSSPEHCFDAARAMAQASRHSSEVDAKSTLIQKALTALERSIKKGYSEPFRIQHEDDLAPLRDEQRFKDVLTKLSNK
jgi:serine/threonine-protein kinase